jgi:hypothetical protein
MSARITPEDETRQGPEILWNYAGPSSNHNLRCKLTDAPNSGKPARVIAYSNHPWI